MKYHNQLTKPEYSFQRGLVLIYKKIETAFFISLCVFFLITSKINHNIYKDIGFFFINISTPFIEVASYPFNFVSELITNFHELSSAKEENKILKQEVQNLKNLQASLINIKEENRELKKVVGYVAPKIASYKIAKIVGGVNQVFNKRLYLDIGSDSGVQEGSVVIGAHGVLGRISEISTSKSSLLLLTDLSSRIPVISSKSRARAILAGNGGSAMEMLYLPKNHNIKIGELIFTSGDGDILPPGLLVGIVKYASEKKVIVDMIEDINNASIVSVADY